MGNCGAKPRDELILKNNTPSDAKAPLAGSAQKLGTCGTCLRLFGNAWAFDNLDLDLEGADWRFAFATSRAVRNSAAVLTLRLLLFVLMSVYLAFSVQAYAPAADALTMWSIHFAAWVDTVAWLFTLFVLVVNTRALLLAGTPEPRVTAPTPWYVSFTWMLYAIALPLTFASMVIQILDHATPLGGAGLPVGADSWFTSLREPPALIMFASLILNNFSYHIIHTVYPIVRAAHQRGSARVRNVRPRARARADQSRGRPRAFSPLVPPVTLRPQIFIMLYLGFTYGYSLLVNEAGTGGLDESGAPFVFYGTDWASPFSSFNGAAALLVVVLLNFKFWWITALVRSLSDKDAWKRIEAAHGMFILRQAESPGV